MHDTMNNDFLKKEPINLYNRIKKLLGLKFKEKESAFKGVFFEYVDGVPQLVRQKNE